MFHARNIAAVAFVATSLVAGGASVPALSQQLRGTGDLGIVIERAVGRVQVVNTTARASLATIGGLGDLSNERGLALAQAMTDRSVAAIQDWKADEFLTD